MGEDGGGGSQRQGAREGIRPRKARQGARPARREDQESDPGDQLTRTVLCTCRPGECRDSYSVPAVLSVRSNTLFRFWRRWLWFPAFAGTTTKRTTESSDDGYRRKTGVAAAASPQ